MGEGYQHEQLQDFLEAIIEICGNHPLASMALESVLLCSC